MYNPAMALQADGEPSPALRLAIEQFNAGDYFECHETLEGLWLAEQGPTRDFYQGLLQIAVGLHHASRGNAKGASSLLERGLAHLGASGPARLGIDVAGLVAQAVSYRDALADADPDGATWALERAPKIHLLGPG